VTRFATAPQRLELLDRQRPSIVPREVGLDELQEELVRDGAGEELLTQLEAVRAAMLDGMLAVLWETAPEWSEEEADGKLALIAECSGPYIEAIELAAAGDHPEGLQELARLCVPRGSREQEHYYRRAFDEAVKAGALAGGHAFADPLVSIARAQHARGEMAAMAETCQAAAALAGESGAEPAATTCRVLYAVAEAGEKLDLDELEVSVGHGADWEQLAAHFLELGNPEFAIRLARIASFDSKGTEARCLVQMGQFERAMELTAEGEVTVDGQCFLADVLSFVGRFKDQLATLLRAFTVAEEDERARAEGRRYKFDDKVTLEAREVDAGLLIEAAHGGELAEAFYRERLDVNSRLVAFLADLLMREGQMQEAMSLLDSRQFFPSCLWGRAVVLDWQRLDSPSASIAPWDQRMARVEVPGYREATRRIASHAAERGEPVAIAMLLCEACLHHRWGQATELIEKAMAVPPKPARSAVDQAVIGIEFPPATEYLWRAGELLKDAGRLDAAKAVWELCRRDGLAEAMFELGLATQAQDPPKSLVYFKEAAARFHPEVLRI
jgi:tetratricopeptide (TPR) repeat protein